MANDDVQKKEFMLSRAKAAVLSRDFELAARLYKAILKAAPDDGATLEALGLMYVRAGQDSNALPVYKRLVEKNPGDCKALTALGGVYRRLDLYQESIEALEQAISLQPDQTEIYYNLGFTYKLMGMYQDALECFKVVIEENPNDILAYNHLGSLYSLRHDSANAIASYRRGLKLDPNHPVLHLNLAKEFEILGKDEEAKLEYESALKAKPGWADALNGYASFLMARNKKHEAFDLLAQGLALQPDDPAMLVSMADLQTQSGNYAEAFKQYRSALSRNPADENALLGLATVYEKEGKFPESVQIFDKLEKDSLMNGDMRFRYVSALLSANELAAASRLLKKLWHKNRLDVNVWNMLSQYYLCSNDRRRFDTCLKRIAELDPQYRRHYRDLGMRCKQLGKLAMSESFLEKYVDKDPSDAEALTALAAVYESLRKLREALATYRRALAADTCSTALEENVRRLSSILAENGEPAENGGSLPADPDSVAASADAADFDSSADDEICLASDDLFDAPGRSGDSDAEPSGEASGNTSANTEDEEAFRFDDFADVSESADVYDPLELDETVEEEDADGFGLDGLVADGSPIDYDPAAHTDSRLPDAENDRNASGDPSVLDFEDEDLDLGPAAPEPVRKPSPLQNEAAEDVPDSDVPPVPELFNAAPRAPEPFNTEPYAAEPRTPEPARYRDPEPPFEPSVLQSASADEPVPAAEPEPLAEQEPLAESDIPEPAPSEPVPAEDTSPEPAPISDIPEPDDPFEEPLDFVEPGESESAEIAAAEASAPERSSPAAADMPFSAAVKQLPELVRKLMNTPSGEKCESAAEMFRRMRDLCRYLPPLKREAFMTGKQRLQLDYVIDRLSGKPGLLAAAEALRTNGLVAAPEQRYDIVEKFDEIAVAGKVFGFMRPLIHALPDKDSAVALDASAAAVLRKLDSVADGKTVPDEN